MTNAFNYLKSNKFQRESSYPYSGNAGRCSYQAGQGVVGTTGYTALPANDPTSIMRAVAK